MSDQNTGNFQFPTAEKPEVDNPAPKQTGTESVDEDAIDHGVEETFPASDPVSVSISKIDRAGDVGSQGKPATSPRANDA